jgi:uncharacterized protein (TIGR01777 family)
LKSGTALRILVSGASGLIGSALVQASRADGDEVLRLVRRPPTANDEVGWDPVRHQGPDPAAITGVDAVVHLAGAGLGEHRWTAAYKRQVRTSRVESTALLATTVAALPHPPRVFLSASGVGYYGDTGEAPVDENSPPGEDFLAKLCQDWEAAAAPAAAAGVRTVAVRSGIVLSSAGGALGKVLPLFRAGLGGRLGSGRQYVSWIARPDHVAALRFLLRAEQLSGPVNATAPKPVTNAAYTAAIAAAVRRPAYFAVPAPMLRAVLGEFAGTVVTGQRVLPHRLTDAGFEFRYHDVEKALRELVASRL